MVNLGQLKEIKDLRKVWPHEALDFTPWLAENDNISLLGDAIGIEMTVDETESSVGSFNVDIFASENGTNKIIIIENQLEETNHEHLGKLITYASGKTAEIIIWLVRHAREEHKAAIEWLNNHTDDKIGFFLCEIKLYQIGNSEPAVKFEVIERPNDWSKEIRHSDNNNPRKQKIYDYWVAFNDYAFKKTEFSKCFNQRKPSKDHWMSFYIGVADCNFSVNQIRSRNELEIELYINGNKTLYEHKDEIENSAGMTFDWRELPEKKASRIIIARQNDFLDQSKWNEQFDWIMESLIKMKKTFKKFI